MVPVGAGPLPGQPSLQCAAAHPGWHDGTAPTAGAGEAACEAVTQRVGGDVQKVHEVHKVVGE